MTGSVGGRHHEGRPAHHHPLAPSIPLTVPLCHPPLTHHRPPPFTLTLSGRSLRSLPPPPDSRVERSPLAGLPSSRRSEDRMPDAAAGSALATASPAAAEGLPSSRAGLSDLLSSRAGRSDLLSSRAGLSDLLSSRVAGSLPPLRPRSSRPPWTAGGSTSAAPPPLPPRSFSREGSRSLPLVSLRWRSDGAPPRGSLARAAAPAAALSPRSPAAAARGSREPFPPAAAAGGREAGRSPSCRARLLPPAGSAGVASRLTGGGREAVLPAGEPLAGSFPPAFAASTVEEGQRSTLAQLGCMGGHREAYKGARVSVGRCRKVQEGGFPKTGHASTSHPPPSQPHTLT